jgi:hypothetical protein
MYPIQNTNSTAWQLDAEFNRKIKQICDGTKRILELEKAQSSWFLSPSKKLEITQTIADQNQQLKLLAAETADIYRQREAAFKNLQH